MSKDILCFLPDEDLTETQYIHHHADLRPLCRCVCREVGVEPKDYKGNKKVQHQAIHKARKKEGKCTDCRLSERQGLLAANLRRL